MKLLVVTNSPSQEQQYLKFACELAKATDGFLHVLHILKDHEEGDTSSTEPLWSGGTVRFLELFKWHYGITCNYEIACGSVHDAVIRTARKIEADLILMENTRDNSATLVPAPISRIAYESKAPLLTVPSVGAFSQIRKIVFVTNEYEDDLKECAMLIPLANSLGAQLVGVHVVNRFEDELGDVEQLTSIIGTRAKSMMERAVSRGIQFEEYQHTDLMEGVSSFIDEECADAIALSVENSTLFGRLAERHLTKESPYWVDVPIILLHSSDSLHDRTIKMK